MTIRSRFLLNLMSVPLGLVIASGWLPAQSFAPATPNHLHNDPWLFRQSRDVAVADFNGDGFLDVVFANAEAPPRGSQIFFGNGDWGFVPGVWPSALTQPRGDLSVADVDGDGDQDLISLRTNWPTTAELLLNNGAGSFTAQDLPGLLPGATCSATADVDADGDIDIIIGHNGQNRLYRSQGAGVFVESTQGGLPYLNDTTTCLLLVDVDADADLDLLTGNQGVSQLALNNGLGFFTDVTATHMPSLSLPVRSLATADVDGDGDLDLALGLDASPNGTNRLLLNNGSGVFTDATAGRLPSWVGSPIAFVDVEGDADPDLLVIVPGWEAQLFSNDGTGHFSNATATFLPGISPSGSGVALADIDADGLQDVVISTLTRFWEQNPYGRNVLLEHTGSGFIERTIPVAEPWGGMIPATSLRTNALVLIDHDHDGDLDLVIGNDFQQPNRLYENDGHGRFTDASAAAFPADVTNAGGIAAGDVNGDGLDDLVLANWGDRTMLFLGSASGGFTDATSSRMPAVVLNGIAVALADVDGDNDLDIVLGVNGQSRLFVNDGAGFFSDNTQSALPPLTATTDVVQLADMDGDGDLDLLAREVIPHPAYSERLALYRNNGVGIFSPLGPTLPSTVNMVAADFDTDGDQDVFHVTTAFGGTFVRVLVNQGNGTLIASPNVYDPIGRESKLLALDIDGDADIDVVGSTISNNQIVAGGGGAVLFRNNGTGTMTYENLEPAPDWGRTCVAGDVDGDGDPDVLIGNKPTVVFPDAKPGQTRLYANLQRHVTAVDEPRLGQNFTIKTWSRPRGITPPMLTATFFSVSLMPVAIDVSPFGAVWLDPTALVPLAAGTTTAGAFTQSIGIPGAASLVGLEIYFQALVEGRDTGGAPELRMTNALGMTIRP